MATLLRLPCPWLCMFSALSLFLINILYLLHLQQPAGVFSRSSIWSKQSRHSASQEDLPVPVPKGSVNDPYDDSRDTKQGLVDDRSNRQENLNEQRQTVKTVSVEPLIYLGEDPSFRVNESYRNTHQVSVRSRGRLGNLMFVYASMLGISKRNYLKPTFPEGNLLWETFDLSTQPVGSLPMERWPKWTELAPMVYDPRTEMLNYETDLELLGYYQSWKYFQNIEETVREEFTFKKTLREFATSFLQKALDENFPYHEDTSEVVVVGVHVRRGDLLEQGNHLRGYNFADSSYILSAMAYFEAKHEDNLFFVVASDDIAWCREHVVSDLAPVVFSEGHKDREDLALLAHCHHVIVTVGTFGWWAAWLAQGTVVYYKDSIEKGSIIDEGFDPKDYFYPNWIGL